MMLIVTEIMCLCFYGMWHNKSSTYLSRIALSFSIWSWKLSIWFILETTLSADWIFLWLGKSGAMYNGIFQWNRIPNWSLVWTSGELWMFLEHSLALNKGRVANSWVFLIPVTLFVATFIISRCCAGFSSLLLLDLCTDGSECDINIFDQTLHQKPRPNVKLSNRQHTFRICFYVCVFD